MDKVHHSLKTLNLYAEAFRDMVNARVGWREEPGMRLKLEKELDWSFLCVAMDILDDASLAIGNVLKFGLDGPTRYDDSGEKYLRLYGLLGATYSQQRAALKLHKLTNCPNINGLPEKARGLKATVLRHQIVAHSLDNLDENKQVSAAYVPVRIELGGFNCTVTQNRGDTFEPHDLREAIREHCDFVVEVLDEAFEKCAGTFFKNDKARRAEHLSKLQELRGIREGDFLIEAGPVRIVIKGEKSRPEVSGGDVPATREGDAGNAINHEPD